MPLGTPSARGLFLTVHPLSRHMQIQNTDHSSLVSDIDFYPLILIEVWLQSPSFEALRFDIDRAVQIRAMVGRQSSKEV